MPRATKSATAKPLPVVSEKDAARLLLHGQGLTGDPQAAPRATPAAVARLIERLGFVQVDTISTVERAHHLILAPRLNGYRATMLAHVLEQDRRLFEHWTHDASIIPLKWYPHWHYRFERSRSRHWHMKQLGIHADKVTAAVLDRITREGPLASRDFEHVGEKVQNSWWGWKPHKVALDYLWRIGVLHIFGRRGFHKLYDLSERVIPTHHALPRPDEAAHVDWACHTALERLGTATAREIAQFWAMISIEQVKGWLKTATTSGEVVAVCVETADGTPPRPAYALANYRTRIARVPNSPEGIRLLCPFDPVLRDRARALRLFNFDFRFEGFVPAAKRVHGYYVMAMLEGDQFVGKLDPKFDRATGTLQIGKIWWEPSVRPTRRRLSALEAGVGRLAEWIGAEKIQLP